MMTRWCPVKSRTIAADWASWGHLRPARRPRVPALWSACATAPLIGIMTYTFARIGAVVAMRVEDYFANGKRWWVRLHEKGGKRHEMPAHHKLEHFLDEYIKAGRHRRAGAAPARSVSPSASSSSR